jgi:toxin ParE1/3/4
MTEIQKSRAASIDLDNIWSYIATDNPDAADTLLRRIFSRCQSYAYQPRLGESRPDLGREVRCFSVGSYVVYYKTSQKVLN